MAKFSSKRVFIVLITILGLLVLGVGFASFLNIPLLPNFICNNYSESGNDTYIGNQSCPIGCVGAVRYKSNNLLTDNGKTLLAGAPIEYCQGW